MEFVEIETESLVAARGADVAMETVMFDQISRIYGPGELLPLKPTEKTTKKTTEKSESLRGTERLLPDLKDRVEISEEGLKAAKLSLLSEESPVSSETTQAIQDNWYRVGYKIASQELSK